MIFTAEHNVSRYRVMIILFIVMLGNLLSRNIHGTQVSLSGLDLIEHPKSRTATGSFAVIRSMCRAWAVVWWIRLMADALDTR